MQRLLNDRIRNILSARIRRKCIAAAMIFISMIIMLITFWQLKIIGITMTDSLEDNIDAVYSESFLDNKTGSEDISDTVISSDDTTELNEIYNTTSEKEDSDETAGLPEQSEEIQNELDSEYEQNVNDLTFNENPEGIINEKIQDDHDTDTIDASQADVSEIESIQPDYTNDGQSDELPSSEIITLPMDDIPEQENEFASDNLIDEVMSLESIQDQPVPLDTQPAPILLQESLLKKSPEVLGSIIEPVYADDYVKKVLAGAKGNNMWQIVAEQYSGRSQGNKTPFGNDDTIGYLQKNVVATDVENEFLVYLSMDKKMTWESYLDESTFIVTTSDKYHDHLGDLVDGFSNIAGNKSYIFPKGETDETHMYYVTFNVYEGGKLLYTYRDTRYGGTPNCSNGTLLVKMPGISECIVVQSEITLKTDGNGQGTEMVADLNLDMLPIDLAFQNTIFDSVSDVLGNHIEFIKVEMCDGTAQYDESLHTITWIPNDNSSIVAPVQNGPPVSGWIENVTQLVYRVRLKTETDSFNSCASNMNSSISDKESYRVNDNAVLNYHLEAISGLNTKVDESPKHTEYPVPYIRGLLYDISFIKQGIDFDGNIAGPLKGAEFTLYRKGEDKPVKDKAGNEYIITSDENGLVHFTNLVSGDYVLKETNSPEFYQKDEFSFEITLSYTDRPNMVEVCKEHGDNMKYTGDMPGESWIINNNMDQTLLGYELPATGGNGIILYILTGMLMMLGTIVTFLLLRRRSTNE